MTERKRTMTGKKMTERKRTKAGKKKRIMRKRIFRIR